MADDDRYEVKLANGETELADSLWGARHVVARRAAFAANPLDPSDVLPATISAVNPKYFGGKSWVETISSVSELSPETGEA